MKKSIKVIKSIKSNGALYSVIEFFKQVQILYGYKIFFFSIITNLTK